MKVKLIDVKLGDVLIADDWFTCIQPGDCIVQVDGGGKYVECKHGHHYLVGQIDHETGYLVGFEFSPKEKLS